MHRDRPPSLKANGGGVIVGFSGLFRPGRFGVDGFDSVAGSCLFMRLTARQNGFGHVAFFHPDGVNL